MTWWNDTGAHWGWAGCLLAVVMLLAFWGAVFAALTALLGLTRTHLRQDPQASRADRATRPAGITIPVDAATAALPRRQ